LQKGGKVPDAFQRGRDGDDMIVLARDQRGGAEGRGFLRNFTLSCRNSAAAIRGFARRHEDTKKVVRADRPRVFPTLRQAETAVFMKAALRHVLLLRGFVSSCEPKKPGKLGGLHTILPVLGGA
jgi:hypothetical protein